MKARIESIESGKDYSDKERRVTIYFPDAGFAQNRLKVRESALGLMRVELDAELEVEMELTVLA